MAEVKLSALPAAAAPNGTEVVPVVQGGVTKRIPVGSGNGLATLVNGKLDPAQSATYRAPIPTGVDDTAALQAALDSLPVGETLYPYTTVTPYRVTGLTIPAAKRARYFNLFLISGSVAAAVKLSERAALLDSTIDGNAVGQTSTATFGVQLIGPDSVCRGNLIKNIKSYGIRSVTGETPCHRAVIERNVIDGAGSGGTLLQTPAVDVVFAGNVIRNVTGTNVGGIVIHDGMLRARVSDNLVENVGQIGIEVFNGCDGSVITGNTVKGAGLYGISVDRSPLTTVSGNTIDGALDIGIEVAPGSIGTVVIGNTIKNVTGAGGGVVLSFTGNSAAVLVIGNVIYRPVDGIRFQSTGDYAGSLVSNNVIIEPTSRGVSLQSAGGAKRVTVRDNTIEFGTNIGAGSTYGILLDTDSGECLVTGNVISAVAGAVNVLATAINVKGALHTITANRIIGKGKINTGIFAVDATVTGLVATFNRVEGTLLNGIHVSLAPLAVLAGNSSVKSAGNDYTVAADVIEPMHNSPRTNAINTGSLDAVVRGLTLNGAGAVLFNTTGTEVRHQVGGVSTFSVFGASVNFADGKNLVFGSAAGTKIANATTQKLGFWNATPVVQPAANPDTSGATLAALETEVNELKALLRTVGLMAP